MSNFHSLEVVARYRDPQLQVSENLNYFTYSPIGIKSFEGRQIIFKDLYLATSDNTNLKSKGR